MVGSNIKKPLIAGGLVMRNSSCCATVALLCSIVTAQGAPNSKEFIPALQISVLQPQADRLAASIASVVSSVESSTRGLSSSDREAAIQSAVQGAIMGSGDDPRVVLAALQAFTLCPTAVGRYSVTQIPVTCTNLKNPPSPEAREALASLEKVIVALVDQSEDPAAFGSGGVAPFVTQPGAGRGGDGGGSNRTSDTFGNTGGGGSSGAPQANNAGGGGNSGNSSSVEVQPGPGGGGSSGYNTN